MKARAAWAWCRALFLYGLYIAAVIALGIWLAVSETCERPREVLFVWKTRLFQDQAHVAAERQRCARSPRYPAVRRPGDLNETFGPLLAGKTFLEYSPRVMSADPLVVYFEKFLSEAEVVEYEDHMFKEEFVKSRVVSEDNAFADYAVRYVPAVQRLRDAFSPRTSLSRFCNDTCNAAPIVQTIEQRASQITGVPLVNFDIQAFHYMKDGYFKPHNDNFWLYHLLPCGTRLYTIVVYLMDVEAGGGTRFPRIGLEAPARRGAAVLFANTLDEDPMRTDPRTRHEGVAVRSGEKRGFNMWLYQYNFRDFMKMNCVSSKLAINLGWEGRPATTEADTVRREPLSVIFQHVASGSGDAEAAAQAVRLFWVASDTGREQDMGVLELGASLQVSTHQGHLFRVRADPGGELLRSYAVLGEPSHQTVPVRAAPGTLPEL